MASRRGAEALLREGRVSVNGATARLGDSADPDRDEIRLDGELLEPGPREYWIVHKPRGVLTTVRDTHGRPTIVGLLPSTAARVFPVGRLDRDTEGLVLLTNDGALAHALLHPSHRVEREYAVRVRGALRTRERQRLERGVELEDGVTAPARVARLRTDPGTGTTRFQLTITEGRKRQIRRALRALGHPVVGLVRVRMGPLRLGRLAPGSARPATEAERAALAALRSRAGSSARKTGPGKGKRRTRM